MNRSGHLRRTVVASLVAASVLACAACSFGAAGGDGTGDPRCDSPGVSADEVKLGLVYSDTGSLAAALTGVRGGVEARLGVANAVGGIHGREVTVEWRDDESSKQANLNVTRELVDRVGVLAMLETSASVTDAAGFLDDNSVPVVGVGIEPVWSQHPNMFAVSKTYADGPAETTFGEFVRGAGGSRALVLVDPRDVVAQSVSDSLTASLRSQGVEISSEVPFAPGSNDPDRVVTTMVDQKVDTLVGAVNPTSFASVLSAARARGVQLRAALAATGYDQRMLDTFHAIIAGMTVYVSYVPFEQATPALDAYRKAMSTYAPQVGQPNRQASILAYIATDLLLAGLAAAGECPTRDGLVHALSGLSDYDGGGLLVTPLDLGGMPAPQHPCYYFMQVNQAGTAFEAVPGGDGPRQDMWCGDQLPG